MAEEPPLLIEPDWLAANLEDPRLRLIDLGKAERYAAQHIPGAAHLDYARIVRQQPPAGGLLAAADDFAALMSGLGVDAGAHVVACDDEGSGRAARLVWTLHVYGHQRASILDGGLHSWVAEGRALGTERPAHPAAQFVCDFHAEPLADFDYVLAHLGDPDTRLLDARSPGEFDGSKRFAERGGHIPGAINLEWTDLMDRTRSMRLKPASELRRMLDARGIEPEREVITYCQTHHRSALSYLALRSLGYARVRGYAGSWSEWGNRRDAPVEV